MFVLTIYGQIHSNLQQYTCTYHIWTNMYQFAEIRTYLPNTYQFAANMYTLATNMCILTKYVSICNKYVPFCQKDVLQTHMYYFVTNGLPYIQMST